MATYLLFRFLTTAQVVGVMLETAAQTRPKTVVPYASVFWGWHKWLSHVQIYC